MLTVVGYILFAIVVYLGGPLVLLLSPIGFLIGFPLAVLAHRIRVSNGRRVLFRFLRMASGVLPAGIMMGAYVFGAALLCRWLFSCSYVMLMGMKQTFSMAV